RRILGGHCPDESHESKEDNKALPSGAGKVDQQVLSLRHEPENDISGQKSGDGRAQYPKRSRDVRYVSPTAVPLLRKLWLMPGGDADCMAIVTRGLGGILCLVVMSDVGSSHHCGSS